MKLPLHWKFNYRKNGKVEMILRVEVGREKLTDSAMLNLINFIEKVGFKVNSPSKTDET